MDPSWPASPSVEAQASAVMLARPEAMVSPGWTEGFRLDERGNRCCGAADGTLPRGEPDQLRQLRACPDLDAIAALGDSLELSQPMRYVLLLELADARLLAAAAQAEADRRGAAVTVAVVDAGGQLLLLERRDGASPASAEVAVAKARMAALNGKATGDLEATINGPRPALLQLAGLLGQPAIAMAGGLPLLHDGHCIGAIGISGMTPEVDVAIAVAGLAALTSGGAEAAAQGS